MTTNTVCWTVLSLLLCGAIWPTQASTPPSQPIRVATEHWPGYTSADGQGAYFELLKIVLEPTAPLHVQLMPFQRSIAAVERQQADVVFAVTAKDSSLLLRSTQPIDTDRIIAVYRSDGPVKLPLNQPDLNKFRLSWRIGYNYGKVLGLAAPGYETVSAEQGVQLVKNHRLDVFLSEEGDLNTPAIKALLEQQMTQYPIAVEPIFFGFAPSERGRALKQHWDKAWQQRQHQPALQDFYRRYPGMRVPVAQ